MGRKLDIKRKSINLGQKGEYARELVEHLEKKIGNKEFSKIMRKLIINEFSNKKEYKEAKINSILTKRKSVRELIKQANKINEETKENLKKIGWKDSQIEEWDLKDFEADYDKL